jgi:hypothetical protein
LAFVDVVVVVVVVVVLVLPFDAMFEFARLVLVVVFAVSPPHAAPRAAKPKSAESAIAFFMKKILLSSTKINLRFSARGQFCPKLFLFWNKRNDIEMKRISQPKKYKFLEKCLAG